MEDIDIETLNFEEYNREIYQENFNRIKNKSKTVSHIDALKNFKKAMNLFAKEFKEKNRDFEEEEEEKNNDFEKERNNNRKYSLQKKF